MQQLAADGRPVLVCGDLNVAHREADLKNWKGNLKKSGFLPAERAWFDRLRGEGRDRPGAQLRRTLERPRPVVVTYQW